MLRQRSSGRKTRNIYLIKELYTKKKNTRQKYVDGSRTKQSLLPDKGKTGMSYDFF